MTSIDKIVIVVDETDEREFIVTIGGREVRVSADALMSQNKFAMEVLKQTDRLWHRVKSADFASMVDGALEKAERVTMPLKPPLRDGLRTLLLDFIEAKRIPKGKNDALLFRGRVLWSDDDQEAIFKFDQFMTFLRSRGCTWKHVTVAKVLVDDFKVQVRGNTHIAGKQVRPYVVKVSSLIEARGHGD